MRPPGNQQGRRVPNQEGALAGRYVVGLGVARRALDELMDLAQGKKPQYSSKTLAQSGFTQVEVMLWPRTMAALEAMAPVLELLDAD